MARKQVAAKREIIPDPMFNDIVVTKFINSLMRDGKKSTAESIFYGAIEMTQEKGGGESGIVLFKKALENCKPLLEVKSRRVGGANYQVPVEVKPARRQSLASRWLIESARGRGEQTMAERLSAEIVDAANSRGNAMKKREDMHRMAEANKAFAHFRW
jgi:small subunit ribosomal protein S7